MRKLTLIAAGTAAASLALTACGGGGGGSSASTSASTTTQAAGGGGGGQTIKLAADPNKIAYDTDMTARLWRVSADLVKGTSA